MSDEEEVGKSSHCGCNTVDITLGMSVLVYVGVYG